MPIDYNEKFKKLKEVMSDLPDRLEKHTNCIHVAIVELPGRIARSKGNPVVISNAKLALTTAVESYIDYIDSIFKDVPHPDWNQP